MCICGGYLGGCTGLRLSVLLPSLWINSVPAAEVLYEGNNLEGLVRVPSSCCFLGSSFQGPQAWSGLNTGAPSHSPPPSSSSTSFSNSLSSPPTHKKHPLGLEEPPAQYQMAQGNMKKAQEIVMVISQGNISQPKQRFYEVYEDPSIKQTEC